ncbi:uncharacterized protein LOC141899011 [Tubulanus polymorphus]|uniref:uncharacterized protein LOC141899011 n=1 Tax=Tubulanus polymorphus TaxID=672921 RepID=UPI003DA2779F
MEKFTVDLDKVLDDFEDAEEENRIHTISMADSENANPSNNIVPVLNNNNLQQRQQDLGVVRCRNNLNECVNIEDGAAESNQNSDETTHDETKESTNNNFQQISTAETANDNASLSSDDGYKIQNNHAMDVTDYANFVNAFRFENGSPAGGGDGSEREKADAAVDQAPTNKIEAAIGIETEDRNDDLRPLSDASGKISKNEINVNAGASPDLSLIETMASMSVELDPKNVASSDGAQRDETTEVADEWGMNDVDNAQLNIDGASTANKSDNIRDDTERLTDVKTEPPVSAVAFDGTAIATAEETSVKKNMAEFNANNVAAVGFINTSDVGVDDAEMDAYLSDLMIPDNVPSAPPATEHATTSLAKEITNTAEEPTSETRSRLVAENAADESVDAVASEDIKSTEGNIGNRGVDSRLPLQSPCPYSYPITTPIESPPRLASPQNNSSEKVEYLDSKIDRADVTTATFSRSDDDAFFRGDPRKINELVDVIRSDSREVPTCIRPKTAVTTVTAATPVPAVSSVAAVRIPRPNSLLGLSKPILPNEMSCFVEKRDKDGDAASGVREDVADSSRTVVCVRDIDDDSMQPAPSSLSPLRPPGLSRPAARPNSFPMPSPTNNKLKRPTSLNLMPRDFNSVSAASGNDDESGGADLSSDLSNDQTTPPSSQQLQQQQQQSESTPDVEPTPDIDVMGVTTNTVPPNVGGPGTSPTVPNPPSRIQGIVSQLGKVAPIWIPDSEAAFCMMCDARFTFTRRRHHCRACGKVFCSSCCSMKIKLPYLDNKENRVCQMCHQSLTRSDDSDNLASEDSQRQGQTSSSTSPNPNNPSEYCSTIPPLQQAQANANSPPPTVMVPVGVLKREGSMKRGEPKNVMFSDGIRPGGDLTELDGSSEVSIPVRKAGRSARKVEKSLPDGAASDAGAVRTKTKKLPETDRNVCLIPDSGLPPVLLSDRGLSGDFLMEEEPDPEKILPRLRSDDPNPVIFAINKNLFVLVKIINLDCCVGRICWCFTTRGMCTVGQDEIVIVLECLPEEKTIPRDVFCHLNTVYEEASKGNTVSDLGHTIFGQSFLGSRDHGGFLYIRPTFQCLKKLILPEPPYIFGILLQKWETPWAKVFPIRLMLRLGAEYRYYPCPLISIRYRNSIFGEIGHTIMNLLADFRDYQYMLPQIKGVVVHMEDKHTYINLPRNRYEDVMKVINNSNDHVMALGTGFSIDADSHLVCIQNEEGNYQTQAINIQNKPRKVTGASFIVFNGALKTSSGLTAKSSIVEDGLMVQITGESMISLKQNLRDMKDFQITCGNIESAVPDETVHVQWVDDDKNVNIGIKSPIDGMLMNGVNSVHIHNATDYVGEKRTIRWTEVFFIQVEDSGNSRCEPVDLSRLAEMLAKAACIALVPRLNNLKDTNIHKLGLRVTIAAEQVGYEIGANGEKLPSAYMNELDNELIPVIHNAASNNNDNPVTLELVFHILE